MFVEIKKINGRNEEGIALVKVEDITGACQQPKHFTRLYDDEGNQVSETEDAPRYAIFVGNQTYIVDETQYKTIKDLLTK